MTGIRFERGLFGMEHVQEVMEDIAQSHGLSVTQILAFQRSVEESFMHISDVLSQFCNRLVARMPEYVEIFKDRGFLERAVYGATLNNVEYLQKHYNLSTTEASHLLIAARNLRTSDPAAWDRRLEEIQ